MTDISQFTHIFRASRDPLPHNSSHRVNKRNRQPLSCQACRIRKLKCDRKHPCDACVKRNDQDACIYGRSSGPQDPSGRSRGIDNEKAQERLRHIEELVQQMATSQPPTKDDTARTTLLPSPSPTSDDPPSAQSGRILHAASESRYLGSTHWSAILDSLQELKTELRSQSPDESHLLEESDEEDDDRPPPAFHSIFDCDRASSIHDVLAQHLPTRRQLERRLATYFAARYLIMPVIHTAAFQRQYEKFWDNPAAVSPLWISIMFSLCSLSARLSEETGLEPRPPPDQISPADEFLAAAGQCLVLAGYTKAQKYLVEALAMYCQAKYLQTLDPNHILGVLLSFVIRLAFQMGYHRDPDNFSDFTPFEGEMRRRVWAMCMQFDLMVSFQLGLPKNIPDDSWDTRSPSNLVDSDFDEDTTVLPPPRSENEPTRVLYFIVKTRLTAGFGRVCSHALSFRTTTHDEVMALDAQVRQTHASIPPILRARKMSKSLTDPAYMVMHRINCEFMHQKSLCILHRKYMAQGRVESTQACVEAATTIFNHFVDLYMELQKGGRMHGDGWMLTSFTLNDFLLAAVVLCLSLLMWIKQHSADKMGDKVFTDAQIAEQLRMVRSCYQICIHRSANSTESRRVASALRGVLAKFADSHFQLPTSIAVVSQDKTPELDFNNLTIQDRGQTRIDLGQGVIRTSTLTPQVSKTTTLPFDEQAPNVFDPDLFTPSKFDIDISGLDMDVGMLPQLSNASTPAPNNHKSSNESIADTTRSTPNNDQSWRYPNKSSNVNRQLLSHGLTPGTGLQEDIDFTNIDIPPELSRVNQHTTPPQITNPSIQNDMFDRTPYEDFDFISQPHSSTTDPLTTTSISYDTTMNTQSFEYPYKSDDTPTLPTFEFDSSTDPFDSFLSDDTTNNFDWNYVDKYVGIVGGRT